MCRMHSPLNRSTKQQLGAHFKTVCASEADSATLGFPNLCAIFLCILQVCVVSFFFESR